jgi:hypothetical protein
MQVRIKDVSAELDRTVSGLDMYLETVADSGVDITLGVGGAGTVILYITNTTGLNKTVTSVKVRGKKLTFFGETEHRYSDSESESEFGTQAEILDFKLNTDFRIAERIARHRVTRFGQPFGEFLSVSVKEKRGDTALEIAMIERGLNEALRISEDSTGHDAYYLIVGEQHDIDDFPRAPTVTWYVEKQFGLFRLDDVVFGELDAGNYLGWN